MVSSRMPGAKVAIKDEDFENAEQRRWYHRHQAGYRAFDQTFDMPNQKARHFVAFVMDNDGKLPAEHRDRYRELSDSDIAIREKVVMAAIERVDNPVDDEDDHAPWRPT